MKLSTTGTKCVYLDVAIRLDEHTTNSVFLEITLKSRAARKYNT